MTVVSLLFLLQVYLEDMPHSVFWLISLLSPVAFTLSIDRVRRPPAEGVGKGRVNAGLAGVQTRGGER